MSPLFGFSQLIGKPLPVFGNSMGVHLTMQRSSLLCRWCHVGKPHLSRPIRKAQFTPMAEARGTLVPFMVGTQLNYYVGGFHWQALMEAVWEAYLVVGVSIGLLVLFRQHWNRQGRLAKGLAASAYTVYLSIPWWS